MGLGKVRDAKWKGREEVRSVFDTLFTGVRSQCGICLLLAAPDGCRACLLSPRGC